MPELRSPLADYYTVGQHIPGGGSAGVRLREVVGWDLVQVTCWQGCATTVRDAIADAFAVAPPAAPSTVHRGADREVLSVAPGRYWCLAARGDERLARLRGAIEDDAGCTTELGHSHVRVRLSGASVRAVLQQEIAIDLDSEHFATDSLARTALHHVPVTLQCLDTQRGVFDLYLPQTLATSTWTYLLDLATSAGYEIANAADYRETAGTDG